MTLIEDGILLVLLVTVLAGVARRLQLPAPVICALGGLVVGAVPGVPDVSVNPDLVQVLVLPPLLYAAALELPTREVVREWRVVAALAIVVVLLSTALTGLAAALLVPDLPGNVALTLGAILAATDAVAVAALARALSLPRRLAVLVQSESLFNDATALVAFKVTVGLVVAGAAIQPGIDLGRFFLIAGGGAVLGLLVGYLAIWVRGMVSDSLTENALSLLTPFAAYLPAEAAHASGLTAVVFCGLFMSPRTSRVLTGEGRLSTEAIWGVLVYLLEGVIFALIGLQLPTLLRHLTEQSVAAVIGEAALLFLAMSVVRFGVLFAGELALRIAPRRLGGRRRLRWREPLMLGWAGTRGVVALAAALALPRTIGTGQAFPDRNLLLVLTTLVILFSLVVQGTTLARLARLLGLRADDEQTEREEAHARHAVARVGLRRLEDLLDQADVPQPVVDQLRRGLEQRVDRTRVRVETGQAAVGEGTAMSYRALRRQLLVAERAELVRLRDVGEVSDEVLRKVQRSLDIEEAGL
ncbi:MAG TPA: Na+/H+ antiporter [Mycobacteriales bacterium]|nr:Na+/H+ antiporter [Mycobacteriales bacterium]